MPQEDEIPEWTKQPVTIQVQSMINNVQKMGMATTLKKAVKGDLQPEELLTPQGA